MFSVTDEDSVYETVVNELKVCKKLTSGSHRSELREHGSSVSNAPFFEP